MARWAQTQRNKPSGLYAMPKALYRPGGKESLAQAGRYQGEEIAELSFAYMKTLNPSNNRKNSSWKM